MASVKTRINEDTMAAGKANRLALADEALNVADCEALRRMYQESEDNIESLVKGFSVMIDGGRAHPLPTQGTIEAMRDVALAAIQLARDVAIQSRE